MLLAFWACLIGFGDLEWVENKATPARVGLVFEEDLRFGGGPQDTWKGDNTHLAVGSDGTIYVADNYDVQVSAYDTQGRFLRRITERGKLPGQLKVLDTLTVLTDNRLLLLDTTVGEPMVIHYFHPKKGFLKSKQPKEPHILRSSVLDPSGRYLFGTQVLMDATTSTEIETVLDLNTLTKARVLNQTVHEMDVLQWKDRAYFLKFMTALLEAEYAPKHKAAFDAEGRLYLARSDRYEIRRYEGGDLDTVRLAVRKDYSPIANDNLFVVHTAEPLVRFFRDIPDVGPHFSPEFIKEWIDKAKLPDNKPPVFGLIAMERGFLVVHDIDKATRAQTAHVFSDRGIFQGAVTMPNQAFLNATGEARMVFRGGFAYTLETDNQRRHSLVRYRVKQGM